MFLFLTAKQVKSGSLKQLLIVFRFHNKAGTNHWKRMFSTDDKPVGVQWLKCILAGTVNYILLIVAAANVVSICV